MFSGLKAIQPSLSSISGITSKVKDHIKQWGSSFKAGLGKVLQYAGALFNIKGIYNTLSGAAQSWLSSQNTGAQQLSANMEYLKYSMGGVFAPIIEYLINLVYQLMKAIQSVVYAFRGINIFANSTATSMGKTAKSAKQASKSLSGIHGEISNVSENNDAGSGSGAVSSSMDLSQIDMEMSSFAKKLYDFFAPLKESWDKYGNGLVNQVKTTASQIGSLIASVWGSFEKIITNGTVYLILQNILGIIGNIAEAFANAWNYNGNGDAIVQSLADAFNNLLLAINNVIQSDGFQNFLKFCSGKFREISEKLSEINWQPFIDALVQIGSNVGAIALNVLGGVVDLFKWFSEHPEIVEFIKNIAMGFIIASSAFFVLYSIMQPIINLFKTLQDIICTLTPFITDALIPAISTITAPVLIIIGIIASLIAVFIHLYNIHEEFRNMVNETWNNIVSVFIDYVIPVIEEIKNFITNVLNTIWIVLKEMWSVIEPFIQEIFEILMNWWNDTGADIVRTLSNILQKLFESVNWLWQNVINPIIQLLTQILKPIVGTVMGAIIGVINSVLNTISNVWNTIKGIFIGIIDFVTGVFTGNWSKAWNGVKSIFSNIIAGLGNLFKTPINFIIDCVNGFIKGLNKLKIPEWIPGLGGKGINIPLIPKLAKGGVIDRPTVALIGEYNGASTNPEIVTPQNLMAETIRNEMSDILNERVNENKPVRVQIYWGTRNVVDEIIDGINEKTRQTGKAQIRVAYDN